MHVNYPVAEVQPRSLRAEGREPVSFDLLLWATHASAPEWLRRSGLDTDDGGFVLVNAFLQSVSHPFVFAVADVAASTAHPRPKSGVYAVRQGPPLEENLRRLLAGDPLRSYSPQRHFLSPISSGNRCAVASWGRFSCEGRWVWRWKDWID